MGRSEHKSKIVLFMGTKPANFSDFWAINFNTYDNLHSTDLCTKKTIYYWPVFVQKTIDGRDGLDTSWATNQQVTMVNIFVTYLARLLWFWFHADKNIKLLHQRVHAC